MFAMSNMKEKDKEETENTKEESDSANSEAFAASLTDKDMNHTAGQLMAPERRYTVEEETTTVHIPMFRPRLAFLEILREVGAQSEVFTIKEIVHHVKDYIIKHQLFDKADPSIVHCGQDKLGMVFRVSSFTVNDAVGLFLKNSAPVPDTCVRIRRQLVKRAINPSAVSGLSNASTTDNNSSSNTVKSSPVIETGVKQKASSTVTSGHCPVITSTTFPEITCYNSPSESNKENCSTSSHHQGKRPSESTSPLNNKKRHHSSTSLNISYSDEVDGDSPCCFQVNMETKTRVGDDLQQESSQRSIEEDSISVQYDSDEFSLEYEVESSDHRSESDISSRESGKDIVVVCKESDVEFWADYSDTEDSTDTELSTADLWVCDMCQTQNIPYHGHCSKCWNLRPGWFKDKHMGPSGSVLPSSSRLQYWAFSSESTDETTPGTSSHCISRSTGGGGKRRRIVRVISASSSGQNSDSLLSDENFSDTFTCRNSQEHQRDSGLSSVPLTSSQEGKNQQKPSGSKGGAVNKGKEQGRWHRGLGIDLDAVAPASDVCVVCASRPKTGSIIHGNSGHQVCCYRCAKRLKRKGLLCPVCRRPIQKVIKNFIL